MAVTRSAVQYRALAFVAAATLLAACAGQQAEHRSVPAPADGAPSGQAAEPRQGGGMRVAATADAVSFHRYKTTDSASSSYQTLVFGGSMVTTDPQQPDRHIPELAESWTVSEDRVTYTFRLREGLSWSDGVPLTSADFK